MENQDRRFTKKGEPLSTFQSRLSKEQATDMGSQFRVFRNKTRIRILDLLVRYGGLLCVVEIAEVLDEHISVISNHLATLRAVGLVNQVFPTLSESACLQIFQCTQGLS